MASNTYDGYLDVDRKGLEGQARSRSPSPRRGSDESSPMRSEYDEGLMPNPSAASKLVLHAYNTKSGFNIRIKTDTGDCLYYVENSAFTPKKPDVTLMAGSEKIAPVIGVCKWSSMYSQTVLYGLGDYKNDESGVVWEEMVGERKFKVDSRWKFQLPNGSDLNLIWRRAHKEDDPERNAMSTKNFKLENESTGEILALFSSNRHKSWKKLGKFTLLVDYGEKWKLSVLLTCLALIEMSRRRSRARRSSAGGGGGGGGGG